MDRRWYEDGPPRWGKVQKMKLIDYEVEVKISSLCYFNEQGPETAILSSNKFYGCFSIPPKRCSSRKIT